MCVYANQTKIQPVDTIKSRIQTQTNKSGKPSMLQMLSTILKEEGVRGLYRGMGPTMMRAIPGSAVALWTYERVSTFLDYLEETNSQKI